MKQKLMQVLKEGVPGRKLTVRVEIDDAYLRGERLGKSSAALRMKSFLLSLYEQIVMANPNRWCCSLLQSTTLIKIRSFAKHKLTPASDVYSGGLICIGAAVDHMGVAMPSRLLFEGVKRSKRAPSNG